MTVDKGNEQRDLSPRITVIGVGGAGNNAVNNMIRSNLQGVQYLVCNTDAQHLTQCLVEPDRRIQLGLEVTQGLGAGSKPEIGRAAAEESLQDVMHHIKDSHMVFITAGMGGGTGTGAAPVIAKAARDSGILTVGVITKPFSFEGPHRMRAAEKGIREMEQYVDTLIIIPNQNLFRIANEKTTFAEAFKMADHVLYSGVRGITDLMIMTGLINLDFADVRSAMTEMGKAMMGTGEASGEGRAIAAAEAAISNPLLDDVSMRGAKGVLINITGGLDLTLFEVDEAANRIREEVDTDHSIETNIIFGSTFDEKMQGTIRVSVVATGIDSQEIKKRLAQTQTQAQPAGTDNGTLQLSDLDEATLTDDSQFQNGEESFMDPHLIMQPPVNDGMQPRANHQPSMPARANNDTQDPNDAIHKLERLHAFDMKDQLRSEDFQRPVQAEPKKGFFTRFIDTIAGRNIEDESGQNGQSGSRSMNAGDQVRHNYVQDETDMQDVPAYLRRKSK